MARARDPCPAACSPRVLPPLWQRARRRLPQPPALHAIPAPSPHPCPRLGNAKLNPSFSPPPPDPPPFQDVETDLARIVGFEVVPLSVAHKYEGEWKGKDTALATCDASGKKPPTDKGPHQEVKEGAEVRG